MAKETFPSAAFLIWLARAEAAEAARKARKGK